MGIVFYALIFGGMVITYYLLSFLFGVIGDIVVHCFNNLKKNIMDEEEGKYLDSKVIDLKDRKQD